MAEEGQSGRMTIYTRAGTSWGDLISDKNEAIPSLHHRHTLPMLDIECKLLWVVINRDSINVQNLREFKYYAPTCMHQHVTLEEVVLTESPGT